MAMLFSFRIGRTDLPRPALFLQRELRGHTGDESEVRSFEDRWKSDINIYAGCKRKRAAELRSRWYYYISEEKKPEAV